MKLSVILSNKSVLLSRLLPMFIGMLLTILMPLTLSSCDEGAYESPVPAGRVHYTCNITLVNSVMQQDKGQTMLEVPGGYVRIYDKQKLMATDEVGTGGLLLLHNFDGTSYYAFDLTCPYCYKIGGNPTEKMHRITIGDDGFKAVCPSCSSEFGSVFWGSPAGTAGPANEHNYLLRQYKAYCVGDNLTVTR